MRLLCPLALLALFFSPVVTPAFSADVKSLGARGDGQADDTAAIQKAVDAGGSITFPTGTYKLTRPITVDLDKTGFVVLSGDATARILMSGAGLFVARRETRALIELRRQAAAVAAGNLDVLVDPSPTRELSDLGRVQYDDRDSPRNSDRTRANTDSP